MNFIRNVALLLLVQSNLALAQQDVVFILTSDRPDSISLEFNRNPVFNEGTLGDGYRKVSLLGKPVEIRYTKISELARLSLLSYGWPGVYIGADWIVEPGDSININIEFESKPQPTMKFHGNRSAKYQIAFSIREQVEGIKDTEYEVYDGIKTASQAYQDVERLEQFCNTALANSQKKLSESVYKTWKTDIKAFADFTRLRIQSYQWTKDSTLRPSIDKNLSVSQSKIDLKIWLNSRALVRYRFELVKWKAIREVDSNYKNHEMFSTKKISLKELFSEIKKEPLQDQQFLMVFSLINPLVLRMNFGDILPEVLNSCLATAARVVKMTELKKILVTVDKRIRPGVPVKNLITTTFQGDTLQLTDLRGKKVILDRWIGNCTGCIDFKTELIQKGLPEIKNRNDIVIWSVGSVDSYDHWKRLLPTNSHPDFTSTWLDRKGAGGDWEWEYNASYAPFIMLIDESGKLISSTVSEIDMILTLLKIH
ncbi:MAG: hypothetical protein HOP30_14015 [Cyclobacteriaceae bacterium]|nr:hypothetical protein [Cyclobacteriaceae bacterium]